MSCKGRLSALAPGAPPPPSFTDLGVCRVVSLTSSHSSLLLQLLLCRVFSCLISYRRGAPIIADWLGLGQHQVSLGAS